VDVVTLSDKLSEKGLLETIGGRERVIDLASAYYTSANIKHHAKIVAEKSTLRRLIKAAADIVSSGYDAREEVEAILEHAEKSIFDIVQRRNSSDFARIDDVLQTTLARLEELSQQQGYITGLETGFTDFDKYTAGLQNSDLILIGARPSRGKTAIMLNIAQHIAVHKGVTTAFFTLEMSKEQLVNRMLCAEANVDASRMRTGRLEDSEWIKIAESTGPLSRAPLYIDETPGISFAELRAKCRRLKVEKNLGLVVIDYLQLMSGSARRAAESRQMEISEISRSLKALAKELNVPVLTAAQLSRAVEARKDHRPMLSDLRESGAIEQDADVVCFLYRDEYYDKETLKKGQAEVIIAKQRNGPTTTVELLYLEKYTKFVNIYKGKD
jgi:replicative DNA helicase